jgi:general secretion pathway protein K
MFTTHFEMNNRGVALILVLWVILLLMVIVLEFSFAMRVEVNAARNFKDEIDCYFYAQSGFQQAVAEIIKDIALRGEEEESEEEKNPWRFDQRKIEMKIGRGKAEVQISNERGKYDLNAIPDDLLRRLIASLGVKETERDIITDSILDWRDDNDLHRLNGAEDDYYESLPKPYPCKDASFETVEELLLVRGVTPSIFYGCYTTGEEEAETTWRKGLVDLVTVYSRSTRVDVNTAPEEVLLSIPGLNEEDAKEIVEARKDEAFKNLNDVRQVLGSATYTEASKFLTISSSSIYAITATGSIEDSGVQRRIKGIVRINLRDDKKHQVIYWADDYPIAENIVALSWNLWEKQEEEPS